MAQLAAYLRPDHFSVDAYREIYRLAHKAWKKRHAVVTERELLHLVDLASHKAGPVVGGAFKAYISKVYGTDVTAVTYDHVVEAVTRAELSSLAFDAAHTPVDELLAKLKGQVETFHPLLEGGVGDYCHSLEDAYLLSQDDAEDDREGLRLGYDRIDGKIRGQKMLPGEMVEILALTNGGKTAFMVGGLAYNLLRQGKRVAYFSLDVARKEIESRMYARLTGLSLDEPVSRRDMAVKVAQAREQWGIDEKAWTVIAEPAFKHTVASLKQILRNISQVQGPLDAVFVDYGQQVKSTSKYDKQYAAAGEVFSELQGWAKEDNFVMITAAQVHRKGYDEDIITLKNIADGFNMTWPAQLILSVNQTRDERRAGDVTPARVALLKNTKGRSQMVFPFKVRFATMEWEDDLNQPVAEIDGVKESKDEKKPYNKQEQPKQDKPLIRKKQPFPRKGDDELDVSAPERSEEE